MGRWNIKKQHWTHEKKMIIKGVHDGDKVGNHWHRMK
jgi:hypothetical protein